MKKIVFVLLAAGFIACQSADQKQATASENGTAAGDSTAITAITWLDSTVKDLGKLKEGQVAEITYRFKNTGTKNLIIENVSASCGCTIPEKPEKAILPGEEGVIRAKFDSRGRRGPARKEVQVQANTLPEVSSLAFTVEVIE